MENKTASEILEAAGISERTQSEQQERIIELLETVVELLRNIEVYYGAVRVVGSVSIDE